MAKKRTESLNIVYKSVSDLIPAEYNPRQLTKAQHKALKDSLTRFGFVDPVLVNIHPDRHNIIIGGHQRCRVAAEMGIDTVPCVELSLTLDQEKELNVRLNKNTGEWDFDALANWFEQEDLLKWGFEEKDLGLKDFLEAEEEEQEVPSKWVPDCLFASNNTYEIPTLEPIFPSDNLPIPFVPYGWQSRDSKNPGTYHFYVDDYRFEAIWDNPNKVIDSSCLAIVEPNLSLFNETPISYGLHLIYKKRWIARYWQQYGINVIIDLNVSPKFAEYNTLGIPDGFNAFCTRGYENRLESLENEYAIAKRVSGKENPFFIVYGGGKNVKAFCNKHNCIFINQIMNTKTIE